MSLHAPERSAGSSDPVSGASDGLRGQVHDAARRARTASRDLATLSTETKNRALHTAADHLLLSTRAILEANEADLAAARDAGTPDAMLDRLALTPTRVDGIADGLRQVAALPDPVGEVLRGRTLPNGLQLRQQRVPSASSASSTKAARTSRSTPSA